MRNKKMSEKKKILSLENQVGLLSLLKAKLSPENLDLKYQRIIKEVNEVNNDLLTIDQFNELIKLDVLGLFKLYKMDGINYVSMYNLLIKVIGYNFMFEEILNKIKQEITFKYWYDNICTDKDSLVDELNKDYIKYCEDNNLDIKWQTTQE